MELYELQDMWQEFDKKLSENTKINKEVLRRILISQPKKRMNLEKFKAIVNLILPIALILLILEPNIQYRSSIDFYIGSFMFGMVFITVYYWSVRYYMLIEKIDFSNPITLIKKDVKKLEKYKIKIKKIGFMLMPFGIIGIFLLGKFPIFSKESFLPLSLIVLVMFASIYYTFKYSIIEQFRKLDSEIYELEKLEIE